MDAENHPQRTEEEERVEEDLRQIVSVESSTRLPKASVESSAQAEKAGTEEEPGRLCIRIRMRLAKYGPMKYIGHLELMRFLQKCLRRTDIDVHYSDGITPRMIMSTAMPLGLGLESRGEYVDIEIGTPVSTAHALDQLRPLMPEGLEILDFRQVGEAVFEGGGTEKKPEKAMSVVAAAEYEVRFRESFTPPDKWQKILTDFVGQEEIPWTKETKKGFRTLDMKPLIYAFSISDDTIRMCVCSRVGTNLRPEQLIGEAFAGQELELPEDALEICRVDLLAEQTEDGSCVRQGDRRRRKIDEMEQMEEKPETAVSLISLGEIGRVISL